MNAEAIGNALLDFFETVDKEHFVVTQKNFILEYVAKNADKGLDCSLIQYLPVMIHFWHLLEDIAENEKKHPKRTRRKI